MCNQLKVEFFKFRHFILFYLGLILMAGVGGSYGFLKFPNANIHDGFAATLGDTSFLFVTALVSAWFVGNDFSNRTLQNEITTGYSRLSVMLVRELPAFLVAVIMHFTYVISTVIGLGIKEGFSFEAFELQDLWWFIIVMLQLIALQSIVVLITFLCARADAAIAASVCVIFIMCNIIRNFTEEKVYTMSCFCLARNHAYETRIPTGIVAIITIVAAVGITWFIFRKREIK